MAGEISEFELVQSTPNAFSYKVTFERIILMMQLQFNSNFEIIGLMFDDFIDPNIHVPERNITSLILPFHGEWTVFWGGDTEELNYHVVNRAQRNAFDFVIMDANNRTFRTDGRTNEDYFAFGMEIIAPSNGEVVLAVDGIRDNIPGRMNPMFPTGNTVIIRTENNEYMVFAHLKQHSVTVREGQMVRQGDVIGLCGNSGNSSEAHLHFHIQNVENMLEGTGIKTYFSNIFVNGVRRIEHSPIRLERVRNE